MRVSVAIMAHPDRARWVEQLQQRLGPVPVAWAQAPYATREDQSPVWETRKAALRLHGDAEYHCVLQDDVELCWDFREHLEDLPLALDRVAMLFYRHKRGYDDDSDMARTNRRTGFVGNGMLIGPGLVFPTERIADLLAHGDDGSTDGDDPRIQRWVRDRGLVTWVPLPSLVDHRRSASLVGHSGWRRAYRFCMRASRAAA